MLVELDCPNCGASLPAAAAGTQFTCTYCGQAVRYEPPARPAPPAPPPVASFGAYAPRPVPLQPQVLVPAPRNSGCIPVVAAIAVIGVVAGALLVRKVSTGGSLMSDPLVAHTAAWHASDDRTPIPVRLSTGDGFVTGLRHAPGQDDTLYFAVVDATSLKEVWRTAPLGKYMSAYQGSHVTVVGKNVVYTDSKNRIHALDLATGRELRTGTFSDRAQHVCPVSDTTVYVDTADQKPVIFDVGTGQTTPADKKADAPASCGIDRHDYEAMPKVPGIQMRGVAPVSAAQSIAWGYKSPGTPVTSVFGFDPKTKAVKWQSPLAGAGQNAADHQSMDSWAFAGNRFYATYKVQDTNDENRIVAFDAASGARLWDVGLRGIFAVDSVYGMGATASFVFVHRMSIIDVLDANTGKQRGTYLETTYDDHFKH